MGLAKHYGEAVEARGWSDVGTTICSTCVVDEALVSAVQAHGLTDACDYCGEEPEVPHASAPIELVLELVVDGLNHEYENPAEQMAWDDGEYVGPVSSTWDLLYELEVTERQDVHTALLRAINNDEWCQRDPYAATATEALRWGWEAFREFVKHRRRFTFLTRDGSTADGAGTIPMHAMPSAIADAVREVQLVVELPAGSEWWRIRPHPASETYFSAADLGTPPDRIARDNRMSPKGIGAFYGASTPAGARAEVAGYADPAYNGSIGRFTTTVPLTVVDLRELPRYPSLFDPEKRHLRAFIEFLYGFVDDATTVADPSDNQSLDYVPTQVVAETFRYDLSADGVLWKSSKDPSVTSCVLFIPCTEVSDGSSQTESTRLVLDAASVGHIDGPLGAATP